MEYNEILNKLIDETRKTIDKNKYEQYMSIINKLNSSLDNPQKIFDITDEELKFINDDKIAVIFEGIKIISSHNRTINENEIVNFVRSAIEKINIIFENDEELQFYKQQNSKLDNIHNIMLNDFVENEEIVLDFIRECYEKNMIDINDAVKLVFYITSKKTSKMSSNISESNEPEFEEIIITENELSISDELVRLFQVYGYDYNSLGDKTKKILEKYGKVNYSEEIIKFLKKYNLSESDFISHQVIISKLMVFQDKTALDKIDEFINNNSCTLQRLLSFGSIFFHRTKKFKFRDKNDDIVIPPKNGFYAPCGQFEGFLYCVELYKKAKKLPDDYKMTDDDFLKDNKVSMIRFFTTPKEKIEKNLFLLKKYGYIKDDELPNALVSLTGKNTEYLLDRLIEAGLYGYGKKYSSILTENDFPYRWYKIKRANDLNEPLFDRGGLKSEFKSDSKSYMGIDWHTNNKKQVIQQETMEMGELVRGGRKLPVYKRERMLTNLPNSVRNDLLPDEVAYREFRHFYKYSVFNPDVIYKYDLSGGVNAEKGLLISTIFKLDYKDSIDNINVDDDYYLKLLDEKFKVDDLTYCFSKAGTGSWPGVRILISRPKVIRLIGLLQKHGVWINKNDSMLDIENLLLSVIVKDTVLSKNDLNMMRNMINDLIIVNYESVSEKGRGIE